MESKNKGRENSIGGDERAPGKGRRAVESSLPSKAKLRRARAGRSEEARNERRFSRRRSVLIRVTALNSKLP